MPDKYSLVSSTPRTPMASWASSTPVRLIDTASNPVVVGFDCEAVTMVPSPDHVPDGYDQTPMGGTDTVNLEPL